MEISVDMKNLIIVIGCTAVLFLAMILQLAAKPKVTARLTGSFIVIAAVSGLLIYGYGYAVMYDNLFIAIVRALLAVCGMFVAKVELAAVSETALFEYAWVQFYFWLVHLMALYATASAAITTVGAGALMKLRTWLARWGNLNLIYGLTPATLEFGKALLAEKKCAVVFIDTAPDTAAANMVTKAGCALRSDEQALTATPKFLKSIGIRPGSRRVTLYAIGGDPESNLPYARAFLASLESSGVLPEQTTLVIPAKEEFAVSGLQVLGERYGYGTVNCFRESSLAARLLMHRAPPCDTLEFDEDGRAKEDFEALLIGFGQMGQAVLRQLVMNAQFVGSTFRADVFSPNCYTESGYFSSSFETMLEQYSIHFHAHNAHSPEMYRHLRERGHTLNYVVICAGSDKANREIAEDFAMVLHHMGIRRPIHLCSYTGINSRLSDGSFTKPYKLYQPEVLSAERLDRMAMVLNHRYQPDDGKTPQEHWRSCDYFSRMSCRAAADFVPAMLRAAGKTPQQAMAGEWTFPTPLLDNLGHMEHLRWNAFHFAMGFRTMTEEEFDRRAKRYLQQIADGEPNPIRIAKDMKGHAHACLVDWAALDGVSRKEQSVTGKPTDYKQADMKNVLAIPELLKLSEEN